MTRVMGGGCGHNLARVEVCMRLKQLLSRWHSDERGAGMMEYALLASLLGVVVIVAVDILGHQVTETFGYVADEMASGALVPPV